MVNHPRPAGGVRGIGALAGGPSNADIANDPNFLKPAEEALSTRQANEAKRQAYVLQRQTEQFKEYEKIATQSLSRVEDAFVRLFTTGEFGAKKMFQAILADLTTPEAGPAELAQYRDQVEQLCRQLDATERHVLALRLDGYTTAEIAQQLGLNHITLRVRLTRLRERLRSSGVLHDWL